jgi:hypothetical protein
MVGSLNYVIPCSQVPNMQIAKVTIPLEKLMEIAYEKEGVKYCTFEVSKLKEADAYGREYTVYHSKLVADAQEPAPKKQGSRKKKSQNEEEKLPF